MPALLAALAALAGIAYWIIRSRNAAHAASDLIEVANDVRLAARRFGFRRQARQHPVEAIDDPKVAIGALSTAFIELDDLPTREQRETAALGLQSALDIGADEADELMVLGHWLTGECGGAGPAVTRLTRRLAKLSGGDGFAPLMAVIERVAKQGSGLSAGQRGAIADISRGFGIR